MAFIYFVFGFFLAAAVTMVLLIVLRPLLAAETEGVRRLAMWAPVMLGALYGGRVAYIGMKRDLGLAAALKRGLMFWRLG